MRIKARVDPSIEVHDEREASYVSQRSTVGWLSSYLPFYLQAGHHAAGVQSWPDLPCLPALGIAVSVLSPPVKKPFHVFSQGLLPSPFFAALILALDSHP